MAEIRRNISSKKRQTQKDRDDREAEKSAKVSATLNNLIKSETNQKPTLITEEADEPGNVFDYSFKQANLAENVEKPKTPKTPPPPPKPSTLPSSLKPKARPPKPVTEKFYFPYGKTRPKTESELFIAALDEFAKENKKQLIDINDMAEIVREMKSGFG